jgi:hypothetical protein
MFRRFWQWLLSFWRKPKELSASDAVAAIEPAEIKAPEGTTPPIIARTTSTLIEVQPAVQGQPKALETGVPLVEIEAAPESKSPDPIVTPTTAELAAETELKLLPAVVEQAAPEPSRPDDWMIHRALYFAAGAYSPAPHIQRVLSPDLLFRLGPDQRERLPQPQSTPSPQALPAEPVVGPKVEPRLMDLFSTCSETEFKRDGGGRVINVDPLLLSLFFSEREAGSGVPEEATSEYLTQPALLEKGIEFRDSVLRNWVANGPPLKTAAFYDLARQSTPHAGTALLLCHNVAKAFARSGEAIPWRVINRSRGEYDDGKSTHLAAILHRDGVLKAGPFAPPSMFYVLFSATEFGTGDPGDYYRFFAAATAAWYAANLQSRVPTGPPSPLAQQLASSMVELANPLREPSVDLTPAYRGWLWANTLSFREGALFSRNDATARSLAMVGMRGASFGLHEASAPDPQAWPWFAPKAGTGLSSTPEPVRVTCN